MQVTLQGDSYELASSFRKSGNELIVCVHGLGCSKEAYDEAWTQEALNDYSLLSFDLLGFGDSPKPEDVVYDLQLHTDTFQQVIEQFSEYKIHLVANSWGPIIALLMSETTLSKLSSFVNVEGRMVFDDMGGSRKAASKSFHEFTSDFFPEMQAKHRSNPVTAYRLDDASPKAYHEGAISLAQLVQERDFAKMFKLLSCKKVYMFGDQNSGLQSIAAIAPVQTIEIQDAGHFMMKENPDSFYKSLVDFLKADAHA